MARRTIYIPDEVKEKIREHLSARYPYALEGFQSASEEEDALTGDFGSSLRTNNQKVFVKNNQQELPGEWTWGITYKKLRGRGPDSSEKRVGADGVFELMVRNGIRVETKSMLFQSKIYWQNDPNLFKQAIKLSTWREAAFLLNFTPSAIEAIDLDNTIMSRGKRQDETKSTNIDQFIGNDFLNCRVGDADLYYDAVKRILRWKSSDGSIVSTKFSIPNRLRITITAPSRGDDYYGRQISNEEIHNHRMDATAEDILSLGTSYSKSELKKARTLMAKIYHADTLDLSDLELVDLTNKRMQEINRAFDDLKSKKDYR